jgi:hypothetical protein
MSEMNVETPIVEPIKPVTCENNCELDPTHLSILDTIRKNGFVVDIKRNNGKIAIDTHRGGLAIDHKENNRRGSYSTVSPCTDKKTPNIRMRPLPDGVFLVTAFDVKSDTPDWFLSKKGNLTCLYNRKPIIKITSSLVKNVDESEKAVSKCPTLWQKSNVVVELQNICTLPKLCKVDNGSPQLVPIDSSANLRLTLDKWGTYKKWSKKKGKKGKYIDCYPPTEIAPSILTQANYQYLRPITGMIYCPVIRSDGSILSTPGYDPSTGLYLVTDLKYFPILPLETAKEIIEDILCDFPFLNAQHKSAAIACVLTFLTRHSFAGATPLFYFDGNRSRVGKGLLTDLIIMIILGLFASRYDWPDNSEERRKAVTSFALSGSPYMLIDNFKGLLGGATIEALCTGRVWKDRLLGINKKVELFINFISMVTGNNCRLTNDMCGRVCHCKLQTDLQDPSTRPTTDFRHPDLIGFVQNYRALILSAFLSIPYHYGQTKNKITNLVPFGGYNEWSAAVREPIISAGWADPDSHTALYENNDDEAPLLRQLVAAWAELGKPYTVNNAIIYAMSQELSPAPLLKAFVRELPDHKEVDIIAKLLRDNQGKNIDDKTIRKFTDATGHRGSEWEVVDYSVAFPKEKLQKKPEVVDFEKLTRN